MFMYVVPIRRKLNKRCERLFRLSNLNGLIQIGLFRDFNWSIDTTVVVFLYPLKITD